MELILHTLIILELSWIANSFNIYEPARVPGWNHFGYSWTEQKPSFVFRKPMAAMVDLTNDLGVAILQDYSYSRSNFAFSPYGVASVLVVLYEGARGESARQIHRAVRFPWDKDITRIGFRDIHRHLRSYFSHEGYLSGITLSKDGSTLKPEYKRILRFYGYDVDVDIPERTSEAPLTTTALGTTTNSAVLGSGFSTTEGYDITTGKGLEGTNITVKPKEVTTSSPDETMTTLTAAEDRESPASPSTTSNSDSITEAAVTESITENQTSGISPEDNTQDAEEKSPENTEQGTQEDTEQSTPGDNEQVIEQENNAQGIEENTEQSTQPSSEIDEEQVTQQTVSSTPGRDEQDVEEVSQQTVDGKEDPEVEKPVVTEEVEQQTTQKTPDHSTDGNNIQNKEGDLEGSGNIQQTTQKIVENVEQNTEGSIIPVQEDNAADTEKTIQETTEEAMQRSTLRSGEGNPADSEQEKVDVQSPQQNSEGTSPTDIQGEAEQNTEGGGYQQDGQPNAEVAEQDTQQSTEENSGTETTPIEEDIQPVTVPTTESNEPTEDAETTTSTDKVEEMTVSTSANIEGTLSTLQEAEGDRSRRSDALDNGMLIPQYTQGQAWDFDDGLGLAYNNPEKRNLIDDTVKRESTSEDWKEIGVALIAEGEEVKWEPKTLDEFLKNLMSSARVSGRTRRLASGRRHELNSEGVSHEEILTRGGSSPGKRRPIVAETSAKLKRRHSTKEKRNISEFLKVPPVTDLSLQLQNGMFDSHVSKDTDLYRVLPKFLFLVDGAIDTPVPMMTYTNVFPFAYIPRLHCKALEFPLDDERYKLLILLPVERRGLRQLIYDLGSYPLREVMDVLRPARVKAMVPTFMVEGFVILTPTLQKMGIWDVFDPRRSDLSGMTSDPDLYVRNIEQSVTVVIRNYVEILDIQTRTMAARHIDDDFTASHPFLYFVMDTATNVALMAEGDNSQDMTAYDYLLGDKINQNMFGQINKTFSHKSYYIGGKNIDFTRREVF